MKVIDPNLVDYNLLSTLAVMNCHHHLVVHKIIDTNNFLALVYYDKSPADSMQFVITKTE